MPIRANAGLLRPKPGTASNPATPPGLSVKPGRPQYRRRHRGHRRRKPSAARRGLSVRDSNGHRFRADSLSNDHPGHRGHRRRKPSAARRGLSVRDSNGHRFPPGCQYQHHRRRDMPAADSGHRFRAGTPCGNMPPGHPQPGNPPRFRADSLSNGHPGRRGKRPPQPGQPAGARGHRNRDSPPGKMPHNAKKSGKSHSFSARTDIGQRHHESSHLGSH